MGILVVGAEEKELGWFFQEGNGIPILTWLQKRKGVLFDRESWISDVPEVSSREDS